LEEQCGLLRWFAENWDEVLSAIDKATASKAEEKPR
jgi:hypothetical protein